jgi:hypothetical protein
MFQQYLHCHLIIYIQLSHFKLSFPLHLLIVDLRYKPFATLLTTLMADRADLPNFVTCIILWQEIVN